MARKCIGLPFGGMIALCAILLLAPNTYAEGFKVVPKKYTISGTVGLADVVLNGFPVSPPIKTDQNGAYSVQVNYGWQGVVTPVKPGYTFSPASKSYPSTTADRTEENYTASLKTYAISGSVIQPGVQMIGFPEEVVSDQSGRYTANVPWNWSGTVTPTKTAWQFEPANKQYKDVARDMKEDNYKASEQMIVISGAAGVEGVVLKGLPGDPTSQKDGTYRAVVKYGWSGKVTPTKEGHEFLPPTMEYAELTANQTNQDYTAKVFTYQISGTAGLAGVVMKGLPGEPMTDTNGYYTAMVPHGWTGKVTPDKPGFQFTPKSIDIPRVTAAKENVDFSGKVIYYTISGTTGTPRAALSGFPGDPVSDDQGKYTAQVEYGWNGAVTPKKEGFIFNPPVKEYAPVTQNMTQNYTAQGITYKITGNTGGQAQVILKGAPGTSAVVSGADGAYSIDVPYGWKGKITPVKGGFTFDPNVREYPEVLYPQPAQDYVARVVQYSVAGRIVDETGNGLAEAMVRADGIPEAVMTDGNGQFDLKVNFGWKGKLTFEKEGYTFNPSTKMMEPVSVDIKNVAVAARVRMLTLVDKVTAGEGPTAEPIAEVKVTPEPAPPGSVPAMSDTTGKYTIRVPYGWTGELRFEKPGFDFDPPTKAIPKMTADIDNVSPKKPVAPTPGPVSPTPGPVSPAPRPVSPTPGPVSPTPGPVSPTPGPVSPAPGPVSPSPSPTNKEQKIVELNQQRNALEAQVAAAKQAGKPVPPDVEQKLSTVKKELSSLMIDMARPPTPPGPQPVAGTGPYEGPGLHDMLTELGKRAGVSITWDATVKNEPVPISLGGLEGLPVTVALQRVLQSVAQQTMYAYSDPDERTYVVYRPITNMFPDTELVTALQDLSAATGVTIIPDPNVTGRVNVNFQEASFEQALDMLLAGKPYVFKRVPDKNPRYYLVADRGIMGRAFIDISETRRVRLNYTTAVRAKALLSPIFSLYVQAESPNPRDPNDMGNTLVVTAVPSMIDRILQDIRQIDRFKRQVLLDARVVVMERGDLLNLGVEWGWPKIQAGLFTESGFNSNTGVTTSGWPYGVQIGYTPDRVFTDSLMMALNLLKENSQADIIANPKVVAQDGRQAEMRVIQEEWFMMQGTQSNAFYYSAAQLQKIESGTVLAITPYIGDNNDITLLMAVEVSDSIPKARGSDLPLVTRRTARNSVTVKDGGTVAVGGLTENRSRSTEKRVPGLSELPVIGKLFQNKNNDKATREVAVFVTAHLVPEGTQVINPNRTVAISPGEPTTAEPTTNENEDEFRRRLNEALMNNPTR